MNEADAIYVLDTGSTDNTVKLLKDFGAIVKVKEIKPWRFDIARNISLEMIPKDFDILVCTDLDEVFNKGWRNELENIWTSDTNRLRYLYNWSLDSNNIPKVTFFQEKIHDRNNYQWIYPVHEVLKYNNDNEIIKTTDKIILNHYPDNNKSRSSYLPLLELSVKEDPLNDRNLHYLGREYMYYKKWNKSIDTLIKHVNLKTAVWKDEKSASMRFIARCYTNLKRFDEARMWLDKAIKETPYLRDPYVEKALLEYTLNNYNDMKVLLLKALEIKSHEKTYINEVFSWDNTIYDLLSIAYFYEKDYELAKKNLEIAIEMDKENDRLINNLKIINSKIKASK